MSSKSHFFRGLKEEYLINFNSTNNDSIITDVNVVIPGAFNWEIKFSFSSESSSYAGLFGNVDQSRVIVSSSLSRLIVNLGNNSTLLASYPFQFNTDYVLKVRRDLSNDVYYSVDGNSEVLLGNNAGEFGDTVPNQKLNIGRVANRYLTGRIYYLKMFDYGNWNMNDGSGFNVQGSDGNNGTIDTNQDINYVNNVMWKSAAPIEYNLVAQYDFNNNLIDSIGGNNGTGTDITYNIGSFGNEAVFNGTTSEVRTPNSTVWDMTNGTNDIPIKIEVLVKFSNATFEYLIAKCPSGATGWEMLKINNRISLRIYDDLTSGSIECSCDLQTDSNGYNNIVFSYDGSGFSAGLDASVNGITNNLTQSQNSYNGTKLLTNDTTFGRVDRRNDRKLNGAISQIKVFK